MEKSELTAIIAGMLAAGAHSRSSEPTALPNIEKQVVSYVVSERKVSFSKILIKNYDGKHF